MIKDRKSPRRTKILATLGPATDTPGMIDKMILAGLDVVRINFSHGSATEHIERARYVRERAKALGSEVGVLVDLQGPKIRISRFKEGSVFLEDGVSFALDNSIGRLDGDISGVGLDYKTLPHEVKPGNRLLLDDGRIVFEVVRVIGERVECKVIVGGKLSNNKGINLLGGGLSAAAITEKDKEDILSAAEIQADYLAFSFPRSAEDVNECRRLVNEAGLYACIVSKVERAEAVEDPTLEEIIRASDAVMIARGDLGVEIGDAQLPAMQKKIIKMSRHLNKIAITATQMMETMIDNPIPTRAEVFDVANAVIDGTDVVMLSGETATGKHPHMVIEAMSRICHEAEKQRETRVSAHRIDQVFQATDESIAMGAMYIANHFNVRAIAALTESGSTALLMSRISSGIPVYAMTPHAKTRQKVTLYRGVYPMAFSYEGMESDDVVPNMINELKRKGAVQDGDKVLVTRGKHRGIMGGTNVLLIVEVGKPA